MVPQQVHSQNRALESVRVHIACPFAICYLLSAIRIPLAIGYRPLAIRLAL